MTLTAHSRNGQDAVLAALSDVVVTVDPRTNEYTDRHYDPDSSYSEAQPLSLSDPPSMVPVKSPFEDKSLPPPPKDQSSMSSKFANAFRRQTTEEKAAKKAARDQRLNDEINKTATRTSRMDIIDRLDLSGINGSSMFHHDSPYDACAPHMNKGKRAPVGAFDPNIDPMTGLPKGVLPAKQGARRRPSDEKVSRPSAGVNGSRSRSSTAPLVPSLSMNSESSTAEVPIDEEGEADHDADAERVWRSRQGYHTQPSNIPDSRHDVSNPNADVWGVSAEPWQDFAQPKAARRSHLSPYSGNGDDRSGTTSAASSVLDMEAIMTGKTKSSRDERELAAGSASPFPEPNWDEKANGLDGPRRNKSLIKRIRSMRDNPNVPPKEEGVEMGSVGRRRRAAQHKHSPSAPPARHDDYNHDSRAAADAAVGLGGSNGRRQARAAQQDPDLLTPRARRDDEDSYFNGDSSGMTTARSEGDGLARSGSLFNRFKRGQKQPSKSTERPAAYA